MPDLAIPGVPTSTKTPGFYFALDFGASPTGAGAIAYRPLVVGNKITTNLTGASPSFTVTAGTQANAVTADFSDADSVAAAFGRGSEVHRMAKAFFAEAPGRTLTCVSSAESGGVRASAVLTFATTATAAFTVRFVLMGTQIDVAVASGDTATVIATNCATAILTSQDLPVTAQFSVGALTITAKHPGPRGNDLNLQAFFVSSAGVLTQIGTGSTTSPGSTTGILSGGTLIGANSNSYQLAGGTTADTVTAVLTALNPTWYARQAWAYRDATALDAIAAQLVSHGVATTGYYEQAVAAYVGSLATGITLATGRNQELLQIALCPISPTPAEELAAQQMAMRLYGDSAAGGAVTGEASDPASNLIGGRHATSKRPADAADWLTPANVESALSNGLTPLIASGVGALLKCVQSITTRCLKNSLPFYGTFDTKEAGVPQFVALDLKSDFSTVFAGQKLGTDHADGTPPRAANVTTVSAIRDRIERKLRGYETDAILRDVEANMASLTVQASGSTPGRVDCFIPCEPIPNLSIIAAKLSQLQGSV